MERTFKHDEVTDRKPVLTARFNRHGQVIEIEAPDGRTVEEPQGFDDTGLANISLRKVETYGFIAYDHGAESQFCFYWRGRLYCVPLAEEHDHKE
ncbi:MAG: hypothetical protein ACREUZ_14795 [Burkholderiales bacterium]